MSAHNIMPKLTIQEYSVFNTHTYESIQNMYTNVKQNSIRRKYHPLEKMFHRMFWSWDIFHCRETFFGSSNIE